MKNADDIYQEIASRVEEKTATHRKISLDELKSDKTIFISIEDMVYHFYSVLNKQIELERESVLRAVSEVLAQLPDKSSEL